MLAAARRSVTFESKEGVQASHTLTAALMCIGASYRYDRIQLGSGTNNISAPGRPLGSATGGKKGRLFVVNGASTP